MIYDGKQVLDIKRRRGGLIWNETVNRRYDFWQIAPYALDLGAPSIGEKDREGYLRSYGKRKDETQYYMDESMEMLLVK